MLLSIVRRLDKELRDLRGVPIAVEYGPVTPARVAELRDVLVLEYDGPDAIGPKRAMGGNPAPRFTVSVGVKVSLHATSRLSGARREEHEERARMLLNKHVLAALDDVLRGGESDADGELVEGSAYSYRFASAGFEPLVDEQGKRVAVGATYVLRLIVDDCATDEIWDVAADPTFALGPDAISSTTKVKGEATEGAGQTACGEG
jgi:hypothetical protein